MIFSNVASMNEAITLLEANAITYNRRSQRMTILANDSGYVQRPEHSFDFLLHDIVVATFHDNSKTLIII